MRTADKMIAVLNNAAVSLKTDEGQDMMLSLLDTSDEEFEKVCKAFRRHYDICILDKSARLL
jgi:hypothetical protein